MTSIGKILRMGRLFQDDGKFLIIPHEGIRADRRWVDVAKAVIKGGADAILTTPGILIQHHEAVAGKIPFVLTVPLDPQYVDIAVKMDAAGVKMHHFGPIRSTPWGDVNRFAMKCEEVGMPFLWEEVPMDKPMREGGERIYDADVILDGCLQSVANGADIIKTSYSGSAESYKKVTSRCPAPVIVLGGSLVPDREFLEYFKGAIDGGAVGGAIGRNTTTHRDPEKMVRAIQKILHEDASVDEALKELD